MTGNRPVLLLQIETEGVNVKQYEAVMRAVDDDTPINLHVRGEDIEARVLALEEEN